MNYKEQFDLEKLKQSNWPEIINALRVAWRALLVVPMVPLVVLYIVLYYFDTYILSKIIPSINKCIDGIINLYERLCSPLWFNEFKLLYRILKLTGNTKYFKK